MTGLKTFRMVIIWDQIRYHRPPSQVLELPRRHEKTMSTIIDNVPTDCKITFGWDDDAQYGRAYEMIGQHECHSEEQDVTWKSATVTRLEYDAEPAMRRQAERRLRKLSEGEDAGTKA